MRQPLRPMGCWRIWTRIRDDFGALEQRGLGEEYDFIFMSDNGPIPARFNAGLRGLKGTVYEGGLRVPFFVRWPGSVQAGTKIDKLTAHIDVFPTLLEACGVERSAADPKIDGSSLYSLLRKPETAATWPDRTLYFQWHRGDRGELYNNCAARSERYKLVNGKELYDLQEDPAEVHDLAAQQPKRVADMRAGYEAWFRDVAATRNFEVPHIYLGTKFENPVLLTRQDWRGPHASWEDSGQGYWEVDVRESGEYECTLLFPASNSEGQAWVSLGGVKAEMTVAAGVKSAKLRLRGVRKGLSRVEAGITPRGVLEFGAHYVEVRRV